jgi:phage tail-like protein
MNAAEFPFTVRFDDGVTARFAEVSGLEIEGKPIEYRHGDSPIFYPIKMPGLGKVGNVTMRKGIFVGDAKLWTWYNEIKMNTIKRRTVTVDLRDAKGAVARTWTLNNAWPTKVSGSDLESEGNEVAVESLEVAFETMVISAP